LYILIRALNSRVSFITEILIRASSYVEQSWQTPIDEDRAISASFPRQFFNDRAPKSGFEKSLLAYLDRGTHRLSVEYNKVQRRIVRLIDSEERRIGDYEGRRREISIGTVPASSGNSIESSDLSAAENN